MGWNGQKRDGTTIGDVQADDRVAGLVMMEIFPGQQLARGSASPRARAKTHLNADDVLARIGCTSPQ